MNTLLLPLSFPLSHKPSKEHYKIASSISHQLRSMLEQLGAIHLLCVRLDIRDNHSDIDSESLFKSLCNSIQDKIYADRSSAYDKIDSEIKGIWLAHKDGCLESYLYFQTLDYRKLRESVAHKKLTAAIPTLWQQVLTNSGSDNRFAAIPEIVDDAYIDQADPRLEKIFAGIERNIRLFEAA